MKSSDNEERLTHGAVSPPELIHGQGEMAQATRSKDWSLTSLGAIAAWPETLLSAVNHLLAAPFPFALYWARS